MFHVRHAVHSETTAAAREDTRQSKLELEKVCEHLVREARLAVHAVEPFPGPKPALGLDEARKRRNKRGNALKRSEEAVLEQISEACDPGAQGGMWLTWLDIRVGVRPTLRGMRGGGRGGARSS